jgi:hypothetical protein
VGPAATPGSNEPGPVHVHGLGVNPADRALYIATHTGLWRASAESRTAERVSDSRQDTMGFTVVGRDHFLGSGHPDLKQMREKNLPPHLGLIRSRDAGRSWETVSLLGHADFHVLRAAGRRVFGVDASTGRFLVSDNGGKSWQDRATPAPLFDLAVNPRAPVQMIGVTEQGIFGSRDGGRSWHRRADGPIGLLAWDRNAVYAVDGSGSVHISDDAGRRWRRVGDINGEPAALLADGGKLYAALHDGRVVVSADGGRTFVPRVDA